MSDTHDNQSQNLEEQLDNSIQEDYPQNYKNLSENQKVPFEQQTLPNENPSHEYGHDNNLDRDSQFQQEGIFSYNDDYRMRQSMKSQEDFELEDVSGNADMSDRKMSQLKQHEQKLNIKDFQNKQISQKTQNTTKQKQSSPKPNKNSKQSQQQNQLIKAPNIQQAINLSAVKNENGEFSNQRKSPQTPKPQINSSPATQKQQWSLKSNKSYSPKPEQDIYQSPKKQQSLQQTQSSSQKPRISFIKQSVALFKQPEIKKQSENDNQQTASSSIRDWFRTSSTKQPQKKQNLSAKQTEPVAKQEDAKQKYKKQMQQQMLGFQQSLAKHQKSNKIFGQAQKQKEKQKINKTHLPQTMNKKKYNLQSSEQMNTEQYRMLLKISFEKKKQNYQMLKEWDKRRAQNMNLHRGMIELLQNEIDKRIKASLQHFQIYTNFFKQRVKQQEKFVNSPVINTKYALQNNSISKNIYINCSVILNSLSQQNQAKCKKIQDFITLIKTNILKDLTDQHLHQSQKELLKVRQKISTLKNSLKKYNAQTQEKSEALGKLFSQSSNNVSINSQNDFYSVQLQFLRCASQQVLIQKRLGQNCLQYYHTALNQELKRAKVIREALLTYSKGLKATYNIELQDVQLQQLSKSEQIKLIEEFYSLDDMFDERSSQLLKSKFKIADSQDITIKQVTRYAQSFQFQNFNSRMLLLKQFHAKYFTAGTAKESKSSREQICYMVITVDYFIHLFFSSQKSSPNFKPDVSLKIGAKQLEIKQQKQQYVDIVKKQEKRGSMISYFWETKNQKSYRVKFSSKDSKQEFCDYVRKLMS